MPASTILRFKDPAPPSTSQPPPSPPPPSPVQGRPGGGAHAQPHAGAAPQLVLVRLRLDAARVGTVHNQVRARRRRRQRAFWCATCWRAPPPSMQPKHACLWSPPLPPSRGSDLQLPFECPSDFIFTIPAMDEQQVDYRMPGFLEHPQASTGVPELCGEAPAVTGTACKPRPSHARCAPQGSSSSSRLQRQLLARACLPTKANLPRCGSLEAGA